MFRPLAQAEEDLVIPRSVACARFLARRHSSSCSSGGGRRFARPRALRRFGALDRQSGGRFRRTLRGNRNAVTKPNPLCACLPCVPTLLASVRTVTRP